MSNVSRAEAAFFGAVARTAEKVRGSGRPEWYLRARLDQMLDDHDIADADRGDVSARAFFILERFAAMAREERPCLGPRRETV